MILMVIEHVIGVGCDIQGINALYSALFLCGVMVVDVCMHVMVQ